MTHICVSKLTILVSDNGLSPSRCQAIIWTNAGILLIGPLGTNFSEIAIEIDIFSFKKMHLKMSSGNWQPSCLGLNVLMCTQVSFCVLGAARWSHDPSYLYLRGDRCTRSLYWDGFEVATHQSVIESHHLCTDTMLLPSYLLHYYFFCKQHYFWH